MIRFEDQEYELLFSNALPPLQALNYADEAFFRCFERLCGARYRILSIIRNGWQQKYGHSNDLQELARHLAKKSREPRWAESLLVTYDEGSAALRALLMEIAGTQPASAGEAVGWIEKVRERSAVLDAMSNMLHLVSVLVGQELYAAIQQLASDRNELHRNFLFYTQPVRESRHAKIATRELPDALELAPRDRNLSDVLRVGVFVKDDVSELLDVRRDAMRGFFAFLADAEGMNSADIEFLQIPELRSLSRERIAARRNLTVLLYRDATLHVSEGTDAEVMLRKGAFAELPATLGQRVLRGHVASPGKARGLAVVVRDSIEADRKMRPGSVLVAPYTAVEYLPAMRMASAIVTETGGITSHAAVVCRELGIPCVIGVKDALSLIRDGKLLEVDADAGEVSLQA